jgi:transketolase
VDYAIKNKGPKYIRLDGKPLEAVYSDKCLPDMDKGFREVRKGKKVCLVATGYTTHTALSVANNASSPVGIVDIVRLKPLDEAGLFKVLSKYEHVVTLEEGFIGGGGLDTLVSGILTDRASGIHLKRVGFNNKFIFELGPRAYLHSLVGLDEPSVSRMVAKLNCHNKK